MIKEIEKLSERQDVIAVLKRDSPANKRAKLLKLDLGCGIGKLKKYVADNEKHLDPEVFSEEIKYMMPVFEKDPASPK